MYNPVAFFFFFFCPCLFQNINEVRDQFMYLFYYFIQPEALDGCRRKHEKLN